MNELRKICDWQNIYMYQQHLIEHALAGGRGKGDEKEKKLKAVVELGVAMMTILVIATAVAKTVVVVVVKEMGKVVGKRVRKAVVTTVTAVEKNKNKRIGKCTSATA